MNTPPRWVPKERTCKDCGNAFVANNPRSRRCDACKVGVCPICNKAFTKKFRGREECCSRSCGSKLHAIRRRPVAVLECQQCGIAFSPANGHTETKYCCRQCKTLASRKPDADKKRNSYKYRQWREAVYARDGYTCQHCGTTDGIQAHHIKPWKDHKQLRYDVANGVTLCQTCHENIHGARIPRVAKRFVTACANCGCETKGRSKYCRPCGIKLSPKAKRQRNSLPRNENGQFVGR